MKVREVIEMLQKNYNAEEEVAFDIWSKEDVRQYLEDYEPDYHLTAGLVLRYREDIMEDILSRMHHNRDATVGLSWDVMESVVEDYLSDLEKEKDNGK